MNYIDIILKYIIIAYTIGKNMTNIQHLFHACLYFNANVFSRHLTKIADQAFSDTGISAPHASVMLMIYDNPGISPKDLSQALMLSPSTITRFIDSLIRKNLVTRKTHGKSAFIYTTSEGNKLKPAIARAWLSLFDAYTGCLGKTGALNLSETIARANEKLQTAD